MEMEEFNDGELVNTVKELISRVKQSTGYKRGREEVNDNGGNITNLPTEINENINLDVNTDLKKAIELSNHGIVETNTSEDDDTTMKLPPLKKMKLNSYNNTSPSSETPPTSPLPPPDVPPV